MAPLETASFQPEVKGPLHGVRVLELARLISGGHAGLVLGDLGADVVKVEQPGVGDPLRAQRVDGVSAYWKVYGRNKRSVTLNLKDPRGRELLLRLAETADVLTENFVPGTLERLGLGPDVLAARNPGLVVLRVSGWGQTGPYAGRPGFGTLAEAAAGFINLNGHENGPPLAPPLALADMVAGLYGAMAALAALRHRDVANGNGMGQVIDISLFEPLHSIMGPDPAALALGTKRKRGDSARVSSVRGVFQTGDGHWIALSAATPELVTRFFEAIGRADVLRDPRFETFGARLQHRDALNAIIADFFRTLTLEEVMALTERRNLTITPVYDVEQALDDPHLRARGTVVEVPDRDGELPGIAMHNVVPRFSETPGALRLPAPRLGEHNGAILGELGLGDAELAALAAEGVV